MKSNAKKIVILIVLGMGFVFLSNIKLDLGYDQNSNVINPKESAGYLVSFIHVDGNWSTTASTYDWCSGDGSWGNPYTIENVTIDTPIGSGILIENSDTDYFIIRNCTVYGAGDGVYDSGIKLYNTNNGILTNNNCSNNGMDGILLISCCENNTLSGNTASYNTNSGIWLYYECNNNTLSGNYAYENDLHGIHLYNCIYNNITGNTANNNAFNGIYLEEDCTNNAISGNTAKGNIQHGIYITVCDSNTVSGNTANDNNIGINLKDYCDNNIILGNTANNNTNFGIYLENDCNYNTILGNYAYENDLHGIHLYNCIYNNITGNTANDNDASGIAIDYDSYDNTISGNFASHNQVGIALDDSNNNAISGNTANDNFNFGIYLENACSNNTISGNTICNNETSSQNVGIRIDNCNNNTISGNTAKDNSQNGIYLYNGSSNNTITGNTASNNDNFGIILDTDCDNNVISGNTANDNGQRGIYLHESDNNTISGNIACNNNTSNQDYGIYLNYSNENTVSGNTLSDNLIGICISDNSDENTILENFFLNNGQHAFDNGTDNRWNSTTIGNYWDNHTGPDTTPQDGIVDVEYTFIGGTAGSIDYLPIAEDGAPSITINSPSDDDVFGSNAPSYDVTITDNSLLEMWYTLDGGLHNYTFTNNGTIDQTAWDVASEGYVTLTFYASDIPGNIGSAETIIEKDFEDPTININSPTIGEFFRSNAPSFIVRITNDNLDTMWYTLDGGLNNYTFTTNGTIDQTAWDDVSDGTITLQFYTNDTLGNVGSAGVNVIKDTVAPIITINSPDPGEIFGDDAPSFIVRITDDYLDTMWYTLDGGLNNYTFTANDTLDQSAWNAMPEGAITLQFYANDTLGHIGTAGVNIIKKIVAPIITINSPDPGEIFGNDAPSFNVGITEDYLDTMWYTLDGGLNNYTFTANGTIDQPAWTAMSDGAITLQFYANDTLGHVESAGVNVIKDTVAPIITINSPDPGEIFGNDAPSYNVTVTDLNLDSVWLVFESITLSLDNPIVGTINEAVWLALPEGTYTITFYANDTVGHETSKAITITKSVPSSSGPGIGLDNFTTSFLIFIMGGMAIILVITRIHLKKRITSA